MLVSFFLIIFVFFFVIASGNTESVIRGVDLFIYEAFYASFKAQKVNYKKVFRFIHGAYFGHLRVSKIYAIDING